MKKKLPEHELRMDKEQDKRTTMSSQDGMDFLDFLIILAEQKRFIVKTCLLCVLLALLYAFGVTPLYKSSLLLMSPLSQQQTSPVSRLSSVLGLGSEVANIALSAAGVSLPSDLIVGIAESRTVIDAVMTRTNFSCKVQKEGFISTLKTFIMGKEETTPPFLEDIREHFMERLQIVPNPLTGIITFSFRDPSPDFAAEVVTTLFEEVQNCMEKQLITQASHQRFFWEKQLTETLPLLADAEQKLMAYQVKTGIIDVSAQGNALMTSLVKLRAELAVKEVELKAARQFGAAKNPQVQMIEAEIKEMRNQLQVLESASGTAAPSQSGLQDLPSVSLEYIRLMREFKIQEAIYEMLLKNYEGARISEAQEPFIIQLLAPAEIPQKKDSPRRLFILFLALFLGIFVGFTGAFFRVFWSTSKEGFAVKKKILRQRLRE